MNASPAALDDRLAALRQALGAANPPAATDRAITAAIVAASKETARRDSRSLRAWRWPALAIGAAAVLVAGIALRSSVAPEHAAQEVVTDGAAAGTPADARSFLPLVPLAEIERSGDAWVVPVQLSRVALAQYGLPIDPARAADAVDTEMLLRRDGAVLAIRLAQ